jgi:hypothetical protein
MGRTQENPRWEPPGVSHKDLHKNNEFPSVGTEGAKLGFAENYIEKSIWEGNIVKIQDSH